MEERAAVARLQAGQIDGLEVLVRAHYARAVRTAYLITRDRALAEDVVQEAFLRAYERIDQFDAARPFGPWFLRSVANAAVTAAARRERHVSWEDLAEAGARGTGREGADPGPSPEDLLAGAERQQELWAALGRLPPAQRAVIIRRYYLDQSEQELARALACPPGTVKWRLHAARARLRALLRPS